MILTLGSQTRSFPYGILSLTWMWFIEITAANDGAQTRTEINESKKNTNGTAIILFVLARKSAEASRTSMAYFKELYPQHTDMPKTRAITPATPIPTA